MISLKQSIEEDAEHLLHAALSSYQAALNSVGHCAARACPPAGASLQAAMVKLSGNLAEPPSQKDLAETTAAIQKELKSWSEDASRLFQQCNIELQDLLLMTGMAAEQVGERDKRYTKRFTEIAERLQVTSGLKDVTLIRQSLSHHSADLKTYVAQMVKDSDETIARLRAQLAHYESKLEQMEQLASQDPLTGLSNRRKVERHIEARIRAGQVFSVISLDLNGFKKLNDTYGHIAGDDLLKQFAAELRAVFRAHDVIGRVGGDEFIVLVDGDLAMTESRLERIRRWVNGRYAVKGDPEAPRVNVTAAAGAAQWNSGESMRDLLTRADTAMYADKPQAPLASRAS